MLLALLRPTPPAADRLLLSFCEKKLVERYLLFKLYADSIILLFLFPWMLLMLFGRIITSAVLPLPTLFRDNIMAPEEDCYPW